MVPQEMEKGIGEADAKVAALSAQQAELDSQAGAVRRHCEELRQEQERDGADVARLTDSKCQVALPPRSPARSRQRCCQELMHVQWEACRPLGVRLTESVLLIIDADLQHPFRCWGWVYRVDSGERGWQSEEHYLDREPGMAAPLHCRVCRPGPSTEL